jgi:hypothetical protein
VRRRRHGEIDWQYTDGKVSNVITNEYANNRYTSPGIDYLVTFTHVVDGHYYGGELQTGEQYAEGDAISVGYDPGNPEKNNLVRNQLWWVIFMWITRLSIPAIFIYFLLRNCKR